MKKRVVITGMGVVSPNGIGNEAFCRAVLAGMSGVKRISRFDASDLPVQIAGEIYGLRRTGLDGRARAQACLARGAAGACGVDRGAGAGRHRNGEAVAEEQREIGVVLGSGGGAQEFSEEKYRLYFAGKVETGQPVLAFPAARWAHWPAKSACASACAA